MWSNFEHVKKKRSEDLAESEKYFGPNVQISGRKIYIYNFFL